jgi:hypothetical protein
MTPFEPGKGTTFSIEGNPTGDEPGWVELTFDPPEGPPTWIGLDLSSSSDMAIEVEFRPNWPGVWHLQAITARPL